MAVGARGYRWGVKSEDVAWAAGLFEGEGWFEVVYSKTIPGAARGLRIGVGSTDRDVLEKLQGIFPGTIRLRKARPTAYPTAKPFWVWTVATRDEVTRIIELLLPWLGERRRSQAETALAARALMPGVGWDNRSHCRRGHPLGAENIYRDPSGVGHCKTCRQTAYVHRQARAVAERGA